MSEYDLPEFEAAPQAAGRARLPGGLSLPALAAILLVVALLAILYLFLGPTPDSPTGLATSTPRATALAASLGTAAPAAGTANSAIGATPVAGASIAGAGTSAPSAASTASDPLRPTTDSALQSPTAAVTAPPPGLIGAGTYVRVGDTDDFGLRLRFGPGFDFATIRIVPDGETLKITGGPEDGEGYTWYRMQDGLGNVGWGAQDFVSAVAAPQTWSPPIASPTFEAGAEGSNEASSAP